MHKEIVDIRTTDMSGIDQEIDSLLVFHEDHIEIWYRDCNVNHYIFNISLDVECRQATDR